MRADYPQACIDVMIFGAGVELMTPVPEVNIVLAVTKEQWPGDMYQAAAGFITIAEVVQRVLPPSVLGADVG